MSEVTKTGLRFQFGPKVLKTYQKYLNRSENPIWPESTQSSTFESS